MAEEETEKTEETEDAATAPGVAAEEAPAEEASAEEAPADDAPAEQPAAEESAAEADDAPAAEAGADAPATDDGDEPAAQLTAKQKRKLERATHDGEPGAQLSDEERQERRDAERKRKAASRSRYRSGRGAKRAEAAGKGSGTGTEPAAREAGNPKYRQGIVVSDKMDKTITVRVESARRHPAYEKVIRTSKMYHAHDERNEAGEGDTVRLVETRPMSKTKHWRLTEILEKAK